MEPEDHTYLQCIAVLMSEYTLSIWWLVFQMYSIMRFGTDVYVLGYVLNAVCCPQLLIGKHSCYGKWLLLKYTMSSVVNKSNTGK